MPQQLTRVTPASMAALSRVSPRDTATAMLAGAKTTRGTYDPFGTRAILQVGQVPGPACCTSGCMGQV